MDTDNQVATLSCLIVYSFEMSHDLQENKNQHYRGHFTAYECTKLTSLLTGLDTVVLLTLKLTTYSLVRLISNQINRISVS